MDLNAAKRGISLKKKNSKSRYFTFAMIYLCILSAVAAGLSLSRYTSGDTATDESGVAIYDVVINTGDPGSTDTTAYLSVSATSKLTEPASMIAGCCQKMQINVINRSECTVELTDFSLIEPDGSVYTKIIIPKNKEEMDELELNCGSVPLAVIDFLGKTQSEMSAMTVEEVNTLISASNAGVCRELSENSGELAPGDRTTLFVVAWVEHDNIYKADADKNTPDQISHQTPTQLGILPESFSFKVYSQQVD